MRARSASNPCSALLTRRHRPQGSQSAGRLRTAMSHPV